MKSTKEAAKIKSLNEIFFPSLTKEIPDDHGPNKLNFIVNLQNQNFSQIAPHKRIDIHFNDLSLLIKEGNIFQKKGYKTILNGLSGCMLSGHLTGIIGPSGSGKTTLMSLLAGSKAKPTTGEILINGQPRDLRTFRKMSCYIMQDDHLLPQLTVWESMMVSANLKLDTNMTKKIKEQIVTDILWLMGLYFSKDTRAEKLSGGQRKRLSIALELVNNPPVMFFDEPTSGLDSVSSYQCLKILKTLAQGGRNIICTIHQPSARLFEIFDDLYILVHGDCMYKGPQKDMLPFLIKHDLNCPSFHNPADFIMDIACGEYGDVVPKLIEDIHEIDEERLFATESRNQTTNKNGNSNGNQETVQKYDSNATTLAIENDLTHTNGALGTVDDLVVEDEESFLNHPKDPTVINIAFQQPDSFKGVESNLKPFSIDASAAHNISEDSSSCNTIMTTSQKTPSQSRILFEKLMKRKKRHYHVTNTADDSVSTKFQVATANNNLDQTDANLPSFLNCGKSNAKETTCGCYACYTKDSSITHSLIHHTKKTQMTAVGFWLQFKILFIRSFLTILRDTTLTRLRFGCHLIVGLIIGMLYYDIGDEADKIWNNSGCLFFSMLFIMFAALMPTVLTFPTEMMVFIKEHLNYWYSMKCYYLAKTLADLPFQIVFPLIYCIIVYWMTSQPPEMRRFFLFLTLATFTALISQSLGLIIGAGMSLQLAVFLGPLTAIPILLFSGFFINFDTIPAYLRWVSYLSYVRYSFEGVLLTIYGFNRPPLQCKSKFCFFKKAKDFLELMDVDNESNFKLDFICLLAFFLTLRLFVYFVLKYRVYKSKW